MAERVAVVTGASRGIGRATAELLAAGGARVVLAARDAAALDEVAAEIVAQGGQARAVPTDLADPAAIERLFAAAGELGPLEVLVNNAAALVQGPLPELTLEGWERLLRLNLTAPFLCAQQALRSMRPRRRGVIVNVGSVGGVPGVEKLPGLVAYATSKGGLLTFSEALAAEVAADGVRVVCVSPGSVQTDMLRAAAPAHYPLGMPPRRVAEVIAFLCSDAGAGINRTNVTVWGPPG